MDIKTYKKLRKKVEAIGEAGNKCPKCGGMLFLTRGTVSKGIRLRCGVSVYGCGYKSEEITVS